MLKLISVQAAEGLEVRLLWRHIWKGSKEVWRRVEEG